MNTAAVGNDWIGHIIDGKFPLLQWLGGSEWSDVFLTEAQGEAKEKAVIKLIPADAPGAEIRLGGFAAAMTLAHPHVLRLFHTGSCQIDGARLHYAVMQYAEEDLSQIIPERPLTAGEAKDMLLPVVDALAYLHGKGIVHGHLKPSNIMVVDNQVKLSSDHLHVGGELGKQAPTLKAYDAPEFATRKVMAAADVWSVGIVVVEALTQHLPIWDRSRQREPMVQDAIPQPFAAIAQDCLWVEPGRRCTLSDVKAHLEPAPSPPASERNPRHLVPGKRRPLALLLGALVLIAGMAVLYMRSHEVKPSQAGVDQQQSQASGIPQPTSAAPAPAPDTAGTPAQSTSTSGTSPSGAAAERGVAERVLPNVSHAATSTIRGTVKVRVRIAVDPGGNVAQATLDSPGPSKYFAKQALEAARQWKFTPTQSSGGAVPSVWMLQFQFRQSGTNVVPTEVVP